MALMGRLVVAIYYERAGNDYLVLLTRGPLLIAATITGMSYEGAGNGYPIFLMRGAVVALCCERAGSVRALSCERVGGVRCSPGNKRSPFATMTFHTSCLAVGSAVYCLPLHVN